MMSSGIYGTVRSITDDRARLEIAPGTEIEIARAAIAKVDAPDAAGGPSTDRPTMPDRRTAQEALTRLTVDVPDWPQEGVTFKDITPVLADHHAFSAIITALAAAGRDDHGNVVVDKVVGMEARGFILAAPVALALGIGFVPVRKAGKLPRATHAVSYSLEYGEATLEVHRDAIAPGERVLMVDDVLATGGTVVATRQLIEACGGVATGVLGADGARLPRPALGDRRPAGRHPADDLTPRSQRSAARAVPASLDSAHGRGAGPRAGGQGAPDRARHACAPRPRRHPPAVVQPGPRAALPRRARQPPQGRPRPARARLRRGRQVAHRPDAQERRPLHHPPARGDHDPRRHRHDRADARRGAAARHRRGHAVHARGAARRLR